MLTIPYTMSVSVVGTPEKGPVYQRDASSGPSSPSESAHRSAASSSPASSPAAASDSGNDGGVSAPVVIGGTAAGVLACAGAATVFLRRRPRPDGGHTQTAPMDVWPIDGGGPR